MDAKEYRFEADVSGTRLDLFLSNILSDFSRTVIQHLIKSKHVKVNGNTAKASVKLNEGDIVECKIKNKEISDRITPQDIPLEILFEDDFFIIINKPSGLVVHPGSGNKDNTLINGLVYHCKKLSNIDNFRPGIIHRLDKDTSGVIIVAKTDKAHINISQQFANRTIQKTYYALVWGKVDRQGIIEGLINRDSVNRTRFKMSSNKGKTSKTRYFLENYFEPISLVKLRPETGRTHQLRVHLNSIGHPIFSDNQYSGGEKRIKSYHIKYIQLLKRLFKLIDRVALHAQKIEFIHPEHHKKVSFSAPFPDDFNRVLEVLKNE